MKKKTNLELMLSELISWKMVAIIENKPTLLQSHFVGQDDVGCFKNMAFNWLKRIKNSRKGMYCMLRHLISIEKWKLEILGKFWKGVTGWK